MLCCHAAGLAWAESWLTCHFLGSPLLTLFQSVSSNWPVIFCDLEPLTVNVAVCQFWLACHFLWSWPLTVYLSVLSVLTDLSLSLSVLTGLSFSLIWTTDSLYLSVCVFWLACHFLWSWPLSVYHSISLFFLTDLSLSLISLADSLFYGTFAMH